MILVDVSGGEGGRVDVGIAAADLSPPAARQRKVAGGEAFTRLAEPSTKTRHARASLRYAAAATTIV